MTEGSLSVPNVGLGDIEVRFNQHSSDERDKALRMLTDMQKRGYAILVRLEDGSYVRAQSIDGEAGVYVVQIPEDVAVAEPAVIGAGAPQTGLEDGVPLPEKKKRGLPRKVRIPIERAHAVGIARSAGG